MSETEQQQDQERRAAIRDALAKKLNDNWTQPHTCPICGSDSWLMGDPCEQPLRNPLRPGKTLPQVYIVVPVFCRTCGYMLTFGGGAFDVRALEIEHSGEQP